RELEQQVPVGHLERVTVLEVDLPLAQAPFDLAGPRAELGCGERVPHPREEALVPVARLDRVIGPRQRRGDERRVAVRAALVVAPVVEGELEFARDLRGEAGGLEALDLPPQDRAW